MKKATTYIGSIILLSFLLVSCKSTKTNKLMGFENDYFGVKGINCIELVNPNAIDSFVGTLECDCATFNYDYGRYGNPGPLTRKEEFRNSFDAFHHIKFFKDRMIDPKVNKLFLDSVKVINVQPKQNEDKLMFDCETCNATAVLEFKKDTYLFPFTMNEKQLNKKELGVSFIDKDPLRYKYYLDFNSEQALFVTPIQNRFKKKKCLSLTVATSDCSSEKLSQILHSVYMKEESK